MPSARNSLEAKQDERYAENGYPNRGWILAAVSLVFLLGSVDGSIVNVVLPTLSEVFGVEWALVQWVVLAYLLGMTVLMVHMGRLADVVGKKRIFAPGIAVFLAGSVLSGLAPSIEFLIFFRFVESIGAAMMLGVGNAIITETWPRNKLGMAIGIASGCLSFGIVLGPLLGGVLISTLGWHSIFFVNLPFGLMALILVMRYVPPLKPAVIRHRFDWAGAATLAAALLGATLGLTIGQTNGFTAPETIALMVGAVLMMAAFLAIERRVAHPMVDLSLFKLPQFSLNLAVSWLVFLAIAGVALLLPFYIQSVMGLSVLYMSLMMAVVPVAIGLLQPIAGILSDRIGTVPLILVGLVAMIVGYLAMATLQVDGTPLGFILRLLPIAVGLAAFYSPNNRAMMAAVPQKRLGVASGLTGTVRSNAQLTGIALLGAFLATRLVRYGGAGTELTTAPPDIVVMALRDQFVFIAGLIGLGLIVMVWAIRQFGYVEVGEFEPLSLQQGDLRTLAERTNAYQASKSSYDSKTGS